MIGQNVYQKKDKMMHKMSKKKACASKIEAEIKAKKDDRSKSIKKDKMMHKRSKEKACESKIQAGIKAKQDDLSKCKNAKKQGKKLKRMIGQNVSKKTK